MVSIDSVYQKVLALANKEKRGYITPQEFNLMARKVQNEIFDSYFHDFITLDMKPKSEKPWADPTELLQQKLHEFNESESIDLDPGVNSFQLPANTYKLISIIDSATGNSIEELSIREIKYTENHPLTKATKNRMVFVRDGFTETGNVKRYDCVLYPTPTEATNIVIDYFQRPKDPDWAYVVINEKPLYNSNLTTNFSLHPAEEETIVSKILGLCGVIIDKQQLIQIGDGMEAGIKASKTD